MGYLLVHKSRKNVKNRLSRIGGHINGIKKMVEENRECSEVLTQIAAVRAALDNVAKILLEDHLESCMVDAVKSGNYEQFFEDLKNALARYL
jgi:DNA-binding FrmR family transcriptional regulator